MGFLRGRGITEAAATTGFLVFFAWLGSTQAGLSQIILSYAISNIALGIAAWFLLDTRHTAEADSKPPGLADIMAVLRRPDVWLIAIVVLTAYSAYWGSFYFTPYATDVLLMSVVVGGAIGAGKNWLRPLVAGYIADKVGVARTVSVCFIVLALSFSILALVPGKAALLPAILANMTIGFLSIFALRGIYFALMAETGIPMAVTGTAAGVLSVIGFTPDIFMPIIGGVFLDSMPGEDGYRYFFLLVAVMCLVGLAATQLILRRMRRD